MKKKILLVFLIVIGLFTLVGCGNNNKNENNSNENKTEEKENDLKIGEVAVEIDMSASFNEMTFKYPQKATYSNIGTYAIMDLMDQSDLLVRVAISSYNGKTIDEAMEGTSLTKGKSSIINNSTWIIYEGKQNDGKNILNYVTQTNGNVYSIAFISDKDINDFVNAFMSNVNFK